MTPAACFGSHALDDMFPFHELRCSQGCLLYLPCSLRCTCIIPLLGHQLSGTTKAGTRDERLVNGFSRHYSRVQRQPCSTLYAFTMIQWRPSHGSYCLQSRIVNNCVFTFLAGIQFCHDIAINPTSQNFHWIGRSRPPDPRLPQASSTGPPPAIAQFKRSAKTVGQCACVVI